MPVVLPTLTPVALPAPVALWATVLASHSALGALTAAVPAVLPEALRHPALVALPAPVALRVLAAHSALGALMAVVPAVLPEARRTPALVALPTPVVLRVAILAPCFALPVPVALSAQPPVALLAPVAHHVRRAALQSCQCERCQTNPCGHARSPRPHCHWQSGCPHWPGPVGVLVQGIRCQLGLDLWGTVQPHAQVVVVACLEP
mmetsp:Transcript_133372/g.259659  ORF Transcript_133372/g.259659 Transcript_133372/m.259659 type:complete len:205 (+) Transcript_133372:1879-2493(+)